MFVILLRIEATKVFDVPWIAHVSPIFVWESEGSWDDYTTHDERTFPGGGELASGGLDPTDY